MRNAAVIAVLALLAAPTGAAAADAPCRARSDLAGGCYRVVGALRLGNGTPSARISVAGTRRVLGVLPVVTSTDETFAAPAAVRAQASFDAPLRRSFLVCPLDRARAGRMQTVCIESARPVARAMPPRRRG